MDVYFFGLLVYLQPIIWLYLYDKVVPIKPGWVQLAGAATIVILALTGWSSGNYTNLLLITYTLMVIYVIHCYRVRPGFQSVCLAFLIVFFNSFFWEFPLHFSSLLGGGNVELFLLQSLHLAPLPFLYSLGFKPPRRWVGATLLLWMVVLGVTWVRFTVHSDWVSLVTLYGSRFMGLAVLLWILRFPEEKEAIT